MSKTTNYAMHCANYSQSQPNNCAALGDNIKCEVIRCPFFTTLKAAKNAKAKTNKRLNELPPEYQRAIADKYYEGLMPWKE